MRPISFDRDMRAAQALQERGVLLLGHGGERARSRRRACSVTAASVLGHLATLLGAAPSNDQINVNPCSLMSQAGSAVHALRAGRTARD